MKKILIVLGAILVLALAYYLISPLWRTVRLEEAPPVQTTVVSPIRKMRTAPTTSNALAKGVFMAQAHEVSGEAVLLSADAAKILRFERFKTVNGPDLRIYLAADLEAKDFIDLGAIRGTEGNINYTVPSDVDTGKYRYVLIWCRAFHVLFSYAKLQ